MTMMLKFARHSDLRVSFEALLEYLRKRFINLSITHNFVIVSNRLKVLLVINS